LEQGRLALDMILEPQAYPKSISDDGRLLGCSEWKARAYDHRIAG
jgi:hypothetical protein